jgi:hypothetical protein
MGIQPQTTENEIIRAANVLQESSPYYLSSSDITWRRLSRQAENLLNSEPAAGWGVLGSLYAIVGNHARMDEAFANSVRVERNRTSIKNWIGNRLNLGFFLSAQELFAAEADPKYGRFSYLFDVGVRACAFQRVTEYFTNAQKMAIDLRMIDPSGAKAMAKLMEQAGLTDADVARHLDVAGEVLRTHRIFAAPAQHLRYMPGVFNGITIVLDVPVGQSEAFDMNIELAQAEEENSIRKHVAFDVVFASTK